MSYPNRTIGLELDRLLSMAPAITDHDVRHLVWLRDRVTNLTVVTTGAHAYRRPDGVCVVPLALLGP